MTTYTAFKNTQPADFNASRMPFFQALEDNFKLFKIKNQIPSTSTLPELMVTNQDSLTEFIRENNYFLENRDLDLFAVFLRDGVSHDNLLRFLEQEECEDSAYIEDEFYGSSIGSLITRMPFRSPSRCIEELQRVFKKIDQRYYYNREAGEKHQLSGFFRFNALNFIRAQPSENFQNHNKWMSQEEMANLLRNDGHLSEPLARSAIDGLMSRHRMFDPYRSYHPLNTDCPLPNGTGKEELAQILISSLVSDKGAVMHLTGVDANAKWRVLKVMAEIIAEHLSDKPESVAKMASQMVINSLGIFEDGLPEKAQRHEVYGGLRDTESCSRLEDWIYSGPLQAHRTEPMWSFQTTQSFIHLIDCMARIYGPLNPEEVLASYLVQMPVIGDISNVCRLDGIEHHILAMPDAAFLNLRCTVKSPCQKQAHQAILVRSAILLQDYASKNSDADLSRSNGLYFFRPEDEDDQRLMLKALCSHGSPSLDLLEACRIGHKVIREHLHAFDDSVKEHILGLDLGL